MRKPIKKSNEAVKVLQQLKVYPTPPAQVIAELRAELVQAHTGAVELIKAPATFAPLIRSDLVANAPAATRQQINEVSGGISTDCQKISKTLNQCASQIKQMDGIKDSDEYFAQSVQVHTSILDAVQLYSEVVQPQLQVLSDAIQSVTTPEGAQADEPRTEQPA